MLEILTHRDHHAELQFWIALVVGVGLLVVAAVARWRNCRPDELALGRSRYWIQGILLTMVAATAISYFYGSRQPGSWVHRWDVFHTAMSTRYFDELGYFKLYECSYVLGREAGHFRGVRELRDPRTQEILDARAQIEDSECAERFSPERREAFLEDIEFFTELGIRPSLFRDKGYNGTPVYSTTAGLLLRGELSEDKLRWLGLIDVLLVVVALAFVARAFGPGVGLLVALLFFVSFPGRFVHMGGSVLRFDYVACALGALAALRLQRQGLAGGLLAVAATSRVFPVFFAAGYGIHAVWDAWRRRGVARRHVRFFGAFAGVCAVLVGASALVYGGFDMWRGWWENIRAHTDGTAAWRIGFQHFFMISPPWGESEFAFANPSAEVYERGRHLAVSALLLVPLLWAARYQNAVSTTGLFGLGAFYLLLVATRYYYAIFAAVLLLSLDLRRRRIDVALMAAPFLLMAGVNRYFESDDSWPHQEFTYNFLFSGLAGVVLALFAARAIAYAAQARRAARADRPPEEFPPTALPRDDTPGGEMPREAEGQGGTKG